MSENKSQELIFFSFVIVVTHYVRSDSIYYYYNTDRAIVSAVALFLFLCNTHKTLLLTQAIPTKFHKFRKIPCFTLYITLLLAYNEDIKRYNITKQQEEQKMKANSKKQAWEMADKLFPTDYIKDERSSANAGYDVYRSTAAGHYYDYICDLGNRLEIDCNGETINIWIEEEPQFSEYQLEDALKVISEAIYQIDDNILDKLQKATGIDEARSKLYGAYAEIAKILTAQHPDSKLFRRYNLGEA